MFILTLNHLYQVTVAKNLGMLFDSNLKYDDHINKFVLNISTKIRILRSLRKIVPIHTLKQLYTGIVQPHFDYGDMVYNSLGMLIVLRLL